MRENVGREGAEIGRAITRARPRGCTSSHTAGHQHGAGGEQNASPRLPRRPRRRGGATREVDMSDDARREGLPPRWSARRRTDPRRRNTKKSSDSARNTTPTARATSTRRPIVFAGRRRRRGARGGARTGASRLRLVRSRPRLNARVSPRRRGATRLLAAVAAVQVTVVSGETGCGKTTQCPQFVLERALAEGRASAT